MKVADIEFVDSDNCKSIGIDSKFVGDNTLVFFRLRGCSNDELMEILEYKSWILKSWKTGNERKYFVFRWSDYGGDKILWTYSGFASILIRYLQNKLGYVVNGKELFRAKEISLGNMRWDLWDFQKDAVQVWIDSGCYGIIKAVTGSGKTLVGCNIIKRMGVRTIIIVHTSDLLIGVWFNRLIEQFGESIRNRIGIIGGGLTKKDRKMMRVCGNGFEENIEKDIVVATSQSLLNRLDELGKQKFGLMIWDETHHVSSEQFRRVANVIRAPARCGLSATLLRPDGTSPMFQGLIGDVVYKIGIRELVKRGYLVEPVFSNIVVYDEECIGKIDKSKMKKGINDIERVNKAKQISGSSEKKKDYILQLCSSLVLNSKKFMMYTDWVTGEDKGVFTRDVYVNLLKELGIRSIGVSSDMSGKEREEVFKYLRDGRIDGIVFGRLGNEGVDIPVVDSVIMCNCTASTILFPQRTGRAMRISPGKKNAYIYEILLDDPKELEWSKRNFYEYASEGYMKEMVWLDANGKVFRKEMVI